MTALLRGRDAARADAALRALSRGLLAARARPSPPGLAGGDAGLALTHTALERRFPGEGHAERASRRLQRAFVALATQVVPPSLYAGFTGVAWVTELLQGDPGASPRDDACAAIDEALEPHLAQRPWLGPFDLVEGLAGIAIYALERVPRPSARRLLVHVVARLDETAERQDEGGAAWRSSKRWLPPDLQKTMRPGLNVGLAHGSPGVIAVLGRIAAADVDARTARRARALLDESVAWLLAQELPPGAGGAFGYVVPSRSRRAPRTAARTAWCYGDPGVAAALLVAAECARERAWERAALRIALRAAARPMETSGVVDAGLCHGAAGVGHLFHRLYRGTGDERLADAARTWLARAVGMRKEGRGVGGFLSLSPAASGALTWHADPSYLTGAAGVALAILAATGDDDLAWDRALAISSRAIGSRRG